MVYIIMRVGQPVLDLPDWIGTGHAFIFKAYISPFDSFTRSRTPSKHSVVGKWKALALKQ